MPYFAYIMSNKAGSVLYTGVTNDLLRRVSEHKTGELPGFTRRYNVKTLVWCEIHEDINEAIRREKQIKGRIARQEVGADQRG